MSEENHEQWELQKFQIDDDYPFPSGLFMLRFDLRKMDEAVAEIQEDGGDDCPHWSGSLTAYKYRRKEILNDIEMIVYGMYRRKYRSLPWYKKLFCQWPG